MRGKTTQNSYSGCNASNIPQVSKSCMEYETVNK